MSAAPAPGSPAWEKLMTAGKVAAVLGLSPWESPYSMWRRMRGELPSDDGRNAEAKSRGSYLEAGVLAWWEDQHPEVLDTTLREQHYATREDMPWAAATVDALAHDVHGNTIIVEAKTSASNDDWGDPGTDEIPAYYAAQVAWSFAMVPEAQLAYVAVLFGYPRLGFSEYVLQRPDDEFLAALVGRCRDFYDSLTSAVPPDLDDTVATYEAIKALHPDIEPDLTVELTRDQAFEFMTSGDAEKAAVKRARAAKTVVLDVMGNANFGMCDGVKVARRQPSKNGVALYTATKIRLDKPEQGTN